MNELEYRIDQSLKDDPVKGSFKLATVVVLESLIAVVIPAALKPLGTTTENSMICIVEKIIHLIIYRSLD
jgi:hypothetical protein